MNVHEYLAEQHRFVPPPAPEPDVVHGLQLLIAALL